MRWSASRVHMLCADEALAAAAAVMEDRKYAKSHEWVKVDGDIATVGISEFAQARAALLYWWLFARA
jgi:glycine cleavage system H protein